MKRSPHRYNSTLSERKILIYFLLVIVILTSMGYLYTQFHYKKRQAEALVNYTEIILNSVDSLISEQKELVIQTRTYLITGDSIFLTSSDSSVQTIKEGMQRLRWLLKDNPLQQKRLDTLEASFSSYLKARDITLAFRKRGFFDMQEEVAHVYAAQKNMSSFNSLFSRLKREEQQLLSQRRFQYNNSLEKAAAILIVLLLLFLVLITAAFIIIYTNTVKRNQATSALRKTEQLINGIINYAPMLVNVKDTAGKFLLVNRQLAHVFNSEPEQVIGKTNNEYLSAETADILNKEDQYVIETLQVSETEVKLPGSDGMHCYIVSKFPLLDERGQLYAIGSTSFDITPIKRAHEALERSYERQQKVLNGLQKLFSSSSDVLCIINEEGRFVQVSEGSINLWGYTPKEMMSKPFMDFVIEEDRVKTELMSREIMSGKPTVDFTNISKRKDGSHVPVLWTALWSEDDKLMYCIARNATEKLKTATQLAQTQSRLAHAQKIARIGNWDWDLVNNEWSCSDEMYELLRADKSVIPDLQQLFRKSIHPDDLDAVRELSIRTIEQGCKVDIEHRIITGDKKILYVHTKGEVTLDKDNKPIWFSGTMQDITQRKEAVLGLKKLNDDLEKQTTELKASNAELERFAYVASHDLQEPLRMVTSFLALLQKKLGTELDETAQKYIHFAADGAERMKSLIQDLLQYSRLGSSNERSANVSLNEVVADVLRVHALNIEENKATILVHELPVVTGIKVQLSQLFHNLVGNALKYRGTHDPQITIGCTDNAEFWQFYVKDNGIGIDPRFFNKIFIIFQRLHNKTEYSGTGIGLAVCKKIVERHGGSIWIDSTPGEGSTFFFTLKKLLKQNA